MSDLNGDKENDHQKCSRKRRKASQPVLGLQFLIPQQWKTQEKQRPNSPKAGFDLTFPVVGSSPETKKTRNRANN